jgi:hypothetical protein
MSFVIQLHFLGTAIAAGFIALTSPAHAVPIAADSTLSLNGSGAYTPTSINFSNPANIGGTPSGSFSILNDCTGCVTMMGSFNTGTSPPFQLYTATEGALATTLQVSSDTFYYDGGVGSLTVSGTGILALTGYDPTPGKYVLTSQGPTGVSVTSP